MCHNQGKSAVRLVNFMKIRRERIVGPRFVLLSLKKRSQNAVQIQNLNRKKEIDGFRAIAVILVILSHLGIRGIPGQTGVLFFFVISGYVITSSILREVKSSGKFSLIMFYKRRALKILPPLFLIILVPSLMMTNQIQLMPVLSQMFFFYNWQWQQTGVSGILPGSQVVWSLSVEEQYYISIAILVAILVVISKFNLVKNLFFLYISILFISSGTRIFIYLMQSPESLNVDLSRILYGTDTRISSIAVGGLVAVLLNSDFFSRQALDFLFSKKLIVHIMLVCLILISVLYRDSFFRNTFKYTLQELICATLIIIVSNGSYCYAFFRKLLLLKLVQQIGLASYSIYLSHLVVIYFLNVDGLFMEMKVQGLTENVATFFFVILVGCLLHSIIDKPFEKRRNSYR